MKQVRTWNQQREENTNTNRENLSHTLAHKKRRFNTEKRCKTTDFYLLRSTETGSRTIHSRKRNNTSAEVNSAERTPTFIWTIFGTRSLSLTTEREFEFSLTIERVRIPTVSRLERCGSSSLLNGSSKQGAARTSRALIGRAAPTTRSHWTTQLPVTPSAPRRDT